MHRISKHHGIADNAKARGWVMKHPHEAAVVEIAKKTLTEFYLKTLADFIKKNYSGSAGKLLPEFREIYKKKFKGGK